MNPESKAVEELTKRIADLEAANNKISSDFKADTLATDNRIDERVAQLVADHLNAKGANRPGITRPIFR